MKQYRFSLSQTDLSRLARAQELLAEIADAQHIPLAITTLASAAAEAITDFAMAYIATQPNSTDLSGQRKLFDDGAITDPAQVAQ